MSNSELDSEIANGYVSAASLKEFRDAEIYGTAAPMQWLEKRLRVLEKLITEGQSLKVYDGTTYMVIQEKSEFYRWSENVFPDASRCFSADK
ncbi:hypothetical protein [Herbaspirillum rhizosphaerae]|uniref:hypothetical protein n=1 Tax=Herbaspirillum rhizosphaerae TaxID=346179 RepID=UPI0012EE0B76|nr:hypothetical protein [Herbaspirillum rhizosphaerae]